MPPLEQIIWEAKHRPTSLKHARHPSTTIDANGCVVQKGFIIPSRTSSFDSRISTGSSAIAEDPGTPASPMEQAPPGFNRPTGSLVDAPELEVLRRSSASPQRSWGYYSGSKIYGDRPLLDRRQTWQAEPSSRWADADLADPACKFRTAHVPRSQLSFHPLETRKGQSAMRRVKSEQVHIQHLKGRYKSQKHLTDKVPRVVQKKDVGIVAQEDAENAIASDSDDDEDDDDGALTMGGIAAQRKRADYATRRARSDELAAVRVQQQQQQQQTHERASQLTQQLQVLKICSPGQAESAIESDDEDDAEALPSGDPIKAALNLAQDHKPLNTNIAEVPHELEDQPRKPCVCFEIEPPATDSRVRGLEDGVTTLETPREIKCFDRLSLVPTRPLRPSKSQPNPTKGVLKKQNASKSAGNSPPKHVVTAVRRSSTKDMVTHAADANSVRFSKT
ncbi:Hypothetical predicted protein [Lecanosticta acicola]|uniref:Uncharacterized protein n=1 Tax=Lecanosticta acicola TaxID=111012 RepID=A0AAI8YXN1_9PEZI|nr:Hypothetical predicted protein [Lecanosticta acicola]